MRYRLYIAISGVHDRSALSLLNSKFIGFTGVMTRESEHENIHPLEIASAHWANHALTINNATRKLVNLRRLSRNVDWDTNHLALAVITKISTIPFYVNTVCVDLGGRMRSTPSKEIIRECLYKLIDDFVLLIENRTHYHIGGGIWRWRVINDGPSHPKGSVIMVTRGKHEDNEAKSILRQYFSSTRPPSVIGAFNCNCLSPKKLRIPPDSDNLAGLLLARVLSYASKMDVLTSKGIVSTASVDAFSRRLMGTIRLKYFPHTGKTLI